MQWGGSFVRTYVCVFVWVCQPLSLAGYYMLQQCCSIPNNNNSAQSIPAENEILFCILCRHLLNPKCIKKKENNTYRKTNPPKNKAEGAKRSRSNKDIQQKKMKSKQNAFERVCSITMCVIAWLARQPKRGRRGCGRTPDTHTHPHTRFSIKIYNAK